MALQLTALTFSDDTFIWLFITVHKTNVVEANLPKVHIYIVYIHFFSFRHANQM